MPELLVFTTRWVLVLGLVTVTVTPATTAPVGSTTVPVIAPVGACAQPPAAIKTIVNKNSSKRRISTSLKPVLQLASQKRHPRVLGSSQYTPNSSVATEAKRGSAADYMGIWASRDGGPDPYRASRLARPMVGL